MDWDIQSLFQGVDQGISHRRSHQAGHVFHMHELGSHFLLRQGVFHKSIDGVEGTQVVLEAPLDFFAHFLYRPEGGLTVPQILQGIEDQENIDAGLGSTFHELFHDVVWISMVAHQILAPEDHFQRSMSHIPFEGTDPVPRIILEKADADVKSCASPHFHGCIAELVHPGKKRDHFFGFYPGSQQGLDSIPEFYTVELDRCCTGKRRPASRGSCFFCLLFRRQFHHNSFPCLRDQRILFASLLNRCTKTFNLFLHDFFVLSIKKWRGAAYFVQHPSIFVMGHRVKDSWSSIRASFSMWTGSRLPVLIWASKAFTACRTMSSLGMATVLTEGIR